METVSWWGSAQNPLGGLSAPSRKLQPHTRDQIADICDFSSWQPRENRLVSQDEHWTSQRPQHVVGWWLRIYPQKMQSVYCAVNGRLCFTALSMWLYF